MNLQINYLILICLLLIGCAKVQRCETNDDCNESQYCYCDESIRGSYTCREYIKYYETNYDYNYSGILVNYSSYKDSPPIECEKEWKIIGEKGWGYEVCIRCTDLNKSVWEGIIPTGDWIC